MRGSQHLVGASTLSDSIKVETMPLGKFKLAGWGYEGASIDDLTHHLEFAGPFVVVDIRLNPVSRKKGFSKRALEAAVTSAGSRYLHLPALGNPKENREGFQHPGSALHTKAVQHFRDQVLAKPEAQQALTEILSILETTPVLLLCFERTSERCHRSPVIDSLLARQLGKLEI